MGNVIFLPMVHNKEWGSNHPWNNHACKWFDTTGYHTILIYFRGFSDSTGIPQGKFSEIRRWMDRTLEGEVLIGINDRSSAGYSEVYAHFEFESDVAAFKLTWGEYLLDG